MSKKGSSTFQKFEIDENTNELKIESVPENQIVKDEVKTTSDNLNKKEDKKRSVGKQIIMNQLLGFEVEKETNKKQKSFKIIVSVIFIAFVVGVLVWTAINDFAGGELPPWEIIWGTITNNWYYFFIALFVVFLLYFFKGAKLSIMCHSLSKEWHFKTCFETGIVGVYYNNITPLAVGGQPFEIHYLSKHGVHGGVASSLPIATFFLNQFAFVVLGIISVAFLAGNVLNIPEEMVGVFPKITSLLAIIGLICCLFMPLLVILFSLSPRIGSALVNVVVCIGKKLKLLKNPEEFKFKTIRTVIHNSKCIKKIATNPGVFLTSLLLSFGEQLANCSIAYFTLKFFGFKWPSNGILEWSQVIQLCVILYAAVSFIPTPGNSGAADLSFYLLFKTGLGMSQTSTQYGGFAFPAMMLWRILSFYLHILIGFIFTTVKNRREKKLLNKHNLLN